jgi:hypothetical protein
MTEGETCNGARTVYYSRRRRRGDDGDGEACKNDVGETELMQTARTCRTSPNATPSHNNKAEASAKRILAVRPCKIKLLLPCKSVLRVVAVFDMLLAFAHLEEKNKQHLMISKNISKNCMLLT